VNNADLIVKQLREAGVRWVFGIPSGPVLPLIEALRSGGVEFVLTASETSAAFMASTVGALTGTPGVCVATLGPGATNLTTGIGAAWLDRAPAIAITCNVGTEWLERRIQMRIDHHALFVPLTKASLPLRNGSVGHTVAEALRIARDEPPGPVHLDLPEDVAQAPASQDTYPARAVVRRPPVGADLEQVLRQALGRSRRPLLFTGLGLTRSHNAAALLAFIERQQMPFISTLHAKGWLRESHPLWAGVLGRARRSDIQAFIRTADLIVAVGFDPIEINYEEFVGSTPVAHVDWDPADVDSTVQMVLNAGGDLDNALLRIAQLPAAQNEWTLAEIAEHRRTFDGNLRAQNTSFGAQQVLDVLRSQIPADGILAYDVGAHTHQIASQWRTDHPRTLVATNGWSSMGFGMPAGYAAKLCSPVKTVVAVVGDGCFRMTAGELDLARRLGLRVPVVVLNDGWLGLMKIKQERREYALSGVTLAPPADSPAHYFGVPCHSARSTAEFEGAMQWALHTDGPTVIEAFVDVEAYSSTVFD
jgi:acetolactate synthase-1/2/3 large subunit